VIAFLSAANVAALVALGAIVSLLATPLGRYLAGVFGDVEPNADGTAGRRPGDRVFAPIERAIFRACRIDPDSEQRWSTYAIALLAFSAVAVLVTYAIQRLQGHLPLNPDGHAGVSPGIAWNTAVSFATNTNWQAYAGESTMSHLTQMIALGVQNFVSAAAGLAVAVAVVRGLVRQRSGTLGNFWVDLVRGVVRVLLPLSFVVALFFAGTGVIMNLHGGTTVTTLEGTSQTIPGGPVASQEAIKQLGTNGGGFFGANSAHPFENPTRLTNLLQVVLLLLIPFALALAFGRMAKDRKQGRVVFAAMFALWLVAALLASTAETTTTNPVLDRQHVSQQSVGGEGKETRFGAAGCGVYAASTTGTSTGAVDCMHDSMSPLGGGTALADMMLGEVSPGGVGAGLYGMLVFVLTAVFIAGLMVGRTPEYLGKRIQAGEVKLVVLYILFVPLAVLGFGAAAMLLGPGLEGMLNHGPHGLSEVLYAYASAGNDNGSAFGGLTVTNGWYTTTLAFAMLVGRFFLMVPALAIAGSLGRKRKVPPSTGTFPTGTPLFAGLLLGVVLIVVGLTYFPSFALGPVVEQLAR
jgi:K+-transporting ATPase ATPase A chain